MKKPPYLEDIPEDWEVVRLGDSTISTIVMGQSPPSKTYNREGKGLPFIQGKMEFGKQYPSPVMYCSNPLKVAHKGDILVSVRAPVGDVNLAPFDLCIGRCIAAIRINKSKAHPRFYFYFFQNYKRYLEALGKGSTFKALVKDDLETFLIPLPPLREQKAIADILSAVDQAIEEVDGAIAKTERLKKGLMQHLFTKGIGHKEFKFSKELGHEIPRGWEVVRLGDKAEIVSGFGFPMKYQGKKHGKYPFIKVGDMNRTKKYVATADHYVDDDDVRALRARVYPPNTIIFPKIGMAIHLNKFRILTKPSLFDNNVAGIIPKDFNPEYLYYYLQGNVDLKTFAGRTTAPSIRKSTLESINLPYPTLQEQKAIADILSTVDEKLDLLKQKKSKLERIKKGLMNLLLTGKVRVKV